MKNNKVELYDTTLRDGTQAKGVNLSLQDKLTAAQIFDELGMNYIEGGYPLSNPKDEQFFVEAKKLNLKNAKIAAFGMTRRKNLAAADDIGMQALLKSEAPVVTIVGKTWDLHVTDVINATEQENLDMIAESLACMADAGRMAIYDAEHFFDGYKANPEFALKTLAAAIQGGAERLVLCDTNGGTMPEDITSIIAEVLKKYPEANLGIHCHDDCGLAVANSLAAVNAGAVQVQGTVNGIGERCGNADLIAIAANLSLKYGKNVLVDEGSLKKLTEVSRAFYELANLNLRDNQPYVGSGAFAHKGGMHVHAVQKAAHTYEHTKPENVGNTRRILVSELSGVSNIAATVPSKFKLDDDRDAQRKILARIVELEGEGYEFEQAEASFEMLIRKQLDGKWYKPLWTLDHYRCIMLKRDSEEATTEATIKLILDNEVVHTVCEGEGPVDSLTRALKQALQSRYPEVNDLHLMDYRVRVVNTQAETAAKVRVVIDWRYKDEFFGSVGVDENIIDASWLALVDAIEYKLQNLSE